MDLVISPMLTGSHAREAEDCESEEEVLFEQMRDQENLSEHPQRKSHYQIYRRADRQ